MKYYRIIAVLFFIIICKTCFTSNNADSLLNLLKTKPETEHAEIYNDLVLIYSDSSRDLAINYANKAIELSIKYDRKDNLAYAYMNLGKIYLDKDDYKNALKYLNKSIPLAEKFGIYQNLYVIYNNMGIIYHNTDEIELALENYEKALKNANKTDDINSIVRTLNNIGNVYIKKEDYDKSLEYFDKAVEIAKKSDDMAEDLASIYSNIGWIYQLKEDYNSALDNYKKSFNIFDSLGVNWGKAILLNNKSKALIQLYRFDEAEQKILIADSLNRIEGKNESRMHLYQTAYELYYALNQYDRAIDYLNKYYELKDSIYSKELYELILDFKLEALRSETELKEVKLNRQRILIILLSLVVILSVIFAIVLLKFLKDINALNKRLKDLNKKVIRQNKLIDENLYYAKYIQDSCMVSNNGSSICKDEHFVLNLPLNIVGGDFYMIREAHNSKYYILADCTGHGVSGGFLSVLAIQYIDILISKYSKPSEITKYLNEIFYNYFSNNKKLAGESLSLSIIKITDNKLSFSGSKQRIWHYTMSGEIIEYRCDNKSLGVESNVEFEEKEFLLKSDEVIYLSTDGYPDQFGGDENKKLKYPEFRNILKQSAKLPINEQKIFLHKEFNNWKSRNKRTDDVLVMGVKSGLN